MGVRGKARRRGMVIPFQGVATPPRTARTVQSTRSVITKRVNRHKARKCFIVIKFADVGSGQLPFLGSSHASHRVGLLVESEASKRNA